MTFIIGLSLFGNPVSFGKIFKRCGMYNDIDGKENHLVKLERMKDYQPPLKTDKPAIVKKKKGRKRKRKIEPKKSNKKAKITDFFSKK